MKEAAKNLKGELHFELPVGFPVNNHYTREVELLKTNGVAEEVFSKKLSEKPYTWIGNVIAIATAKIGDVSVGHTVREEYLKTGSVNIPSVVMKMPLADANTMLVEVHRRVWQNIIPKQEIMCKYCSRTLVDDINLSCIELSEESKKLIADNNGNPFEFIVVTLPDGFTVNDWVKLMKKDEEYSHLIDHTFNRMIFRIPTLGDAVRNEKLSVIDNIKFWRKLSIDCLVKIEEIRDNKTIVEFPSDQLIFLGTKLFDQYLSSEDLRAIRDAIREDCPTMPFDYNDTCPCPSNKEIPFSMEASSFFSV